MDPFLEGPNWPDLHTSLTTEIRNELNLILPRPYFAVLQSRPELGIVATPEEKPRPIFPDVTVLREWRSAPGSGTAVLPPHGARCRRN
jgi:hypothetical protein